MNKDIAQVVKIATLFVLSYVAFPYGNNQTLVHRHYVAIVVALFIYLFIHSYILFLIS